MLWYYPSAKSSPFITVAIVLFGLLSMPSDSLADDPTKVFVEDVSVVGFPKMSESDAALMGQAIACDIQSTIARNPRYLPMTFENLQAQLRKERRLEQLQCSRKDEKCVLQILDNFGCSQRLFAVLRYVGGKVQISLTRVDGDEIVNNGARSAYANDDLQAISEAAQELAGELFGVRTRQSQLSSGGTTKTDTKTVASNSGSHTSTAPAVLIEAQEVKISAGSFTMGSHHGERMEEPEHEVNVSTYWIDKYEVTQAQYAEFVQTTNRVPPSCHWKPGGEYANHPVVCVSWHDAQAYCKWKGKRLPTEAEWEKAARGTDARPFPWGGSEASCQRAIMHGGEVGCGANFAQSVGSRPHGASPYGLMDMSGNVWEWVSDWFDEDYYTWLSRWNNSDNPLGPPDGKLKVARGGSWGDSMSTYLRTTKRNRKAPSDLSKYYGFRCARSN